MPHSTSATGPSSAPGRIARPAPTHPTNYTGPARTALGSPCSAGAVPAVKAMANPCGRPLPRRHLMLSALALVTLLGWLLLFALITL